MDEVDRYLVIPLSFVSFFKKDTFLVETVEMVTQNDSYTLDIFAVKNKWVSGLKIYDYFSKDWLRQGSRF